MDKKKTILILIIFIGIAVSARLLFSLNSADMGEGYKGGITGYTVADIGEEGANESDSSIKSDREGEGPDIPDLSRIPNPLRHLSS